MGDGEQNMKIKAWIRMGVERRETLIEISDEEMESLEEWVGERPQNSLEGALWRYVQDWLSAQFGYGWEGGGEGEDLSRNEGMPDGVLSVTSESSIPNTVSIRLDCPVCRARRF
jgi:hypothetical protein